MLPVIIFAEEHKDTYPKDFIRKNIKLLKELGYKAFAYEDNHQKSIDDIILDFRETIELTQKIFLAAQKDPAALLNAPPDKKAEFDFYKSRAPSEKAIYNLLLEIKRHEISYYGIDRELDEIRNDLFKIKAGSLAGHKETRESFMVKNLIELREQYRGGVIVLIGFGHLEGLQRGLIETLGEDVAKNNFVYISTGAFHQQETKAIISRVKDNSLFQSAICPAGIIFWDQRNANIIEANCGELQTLIRLKTLPAVNLQEEKRKKETTIDSSNVALKRGFFDSKKTKQIKESKLEEESIDPLGSDGEPTTKFEFYIPK